MSEITVTVPALAEYVHILRTAVASVAARLNFSYDSIDDLRMAVDEACAHLLAVSLPTSSLTLRMEPSDGSLVVVASTNAEPGEWPPPGARRTLAWQVLSALADEVGFESEGTGAALRMVKRGAETP